jgi:hypothetical protein
VECNKWLVGNTTNSLWTVLPQEEKAVGDVHYCARGLFWRW